MIEGNADVGMVFSVLAAVMAILGLVTLFKPIPRLKLTTRGRSLVLVAVGLTVLMLVGRPPQRNHAAPGSQGIAGVGQQGPRDRQGPQGPAGGAAQGPGVQGAQGGPADQTTPHKQARRGPEQQQRQELPILPSTIGVKQLRFLAALEEARTAGTVTDAAAQAAARTQRLASICQVIQEPAVTSWIARVKGMTSDADGRGLISVEIGNHVILTTATNPQTEAEAATLIPRKSTLYTEVSRFKTGDMVTITGEFVPGTDACVREVGDLRTMLTEPAFLFKFTTLARYY